MIPEVALPLAVRLGPIDPNVFQQSIIEIHEFASLFCDLNPATDFCQHAVNCGIEPLQGGSEANFGLMIRLERECHCFVYPLSNAC